MIYLCYSASRRATFALYNNVLVQFPDNITRGRRFFGSLCANATLMTSDEKRFAHYALIGRSLNWILKTPHTSQREYNLQHFGTVVNDEAAI